MTFIEHRTSPRSDRATGPVTGPGPTTPVTSPAAAVTSVTAVAGIEMWERFSFYGMQAILVYFLYHAVDRGGLGVDRTTATAVIGAYGAAVYLCTIAGGWIGDRLLGAERTLTGGALLLVAGHLTMGAFGTVATTVCGLALIAAGSGALKASAVAVLGRAFDGPATGAGDPGDGTARRRDAGFLVFYLGINIGAFLGPLLTGWLQQRYGFHAGFGAAAGLMVLGLLVYAVLRRRYLSAMTPDARRGVLSPGQPADRRTTVTVIAGTATVLTVVAVAAATGTVGATALTNGMLVAVVLAAVLTFRSMLTAPGVTADETRGIRSFIPLFTGSAVFWALLNQNFGVLAVYSDLRLDRTVFGWEMPAAWTQSFNPVFMLVLIPVTGWLWNRSGRRRAPAGATAATATRRMSVGVATAGAGMLVFLPFAGAGDAGTPLPVLALAVLLITAGEINVGPVGMAAAAALAPARFATRFSALYFLSMAVGTAAAGVLSGFYSPGDPGAERLYFLGCAVAAVGTAVVLRTVPRRAGR